jgi:hypothetical protein
VRLIAQSDINRNDFGVDGNLMGSIADTTQITADVVFRRTEA